MNSLPPRYPTNTNVALSLVTLSDEKVSSSSDPSMKSPRIAFRPSNGDFLQPPHLVYDKPKVSKPSPRTPVKGKKKDDAAADEIAALKVKLARAKTEARHHERLVRALRRENSRLRLMIPEQEVHEGSDHIVYLSNSTIQDADFIGAPMITPISTNEVRDNALDTLIRNIGFLGIESDVPTCVDDNKSMAYSDNSLQGEDFLSSDDEKWILSD